MRVRPGCRVGEVHLLDWSPQLLLLSHLLHNSSLDIYFCFVQTRVKFMIFERLLSLKHCWKTLPWSFSLFCPHLFFAQSLLLLPCLENLKRRVWDQIGIAWYCAVLRAWYWEPEEGRLRQNWYCAVLRGIARMVLRTWSGASEASLARNICSNLEKPRSAILASSAGQSNPYLI